MPLTRVYLPLTTDDLDALAAGRGLGPAPLAAHGVTPALGRPGLTTDEEELEHHAWVAATEEASLRAAGSRRVVAAADVDAAVVSVPERPDVPSRVEVGAPVAGNRVVSFHVDEEPGGTGTADLLWYDVTELGAVRALVTG
ncbi:DUF6912 family protein [Phycicoccus sonneratiae]|uniref:Uncharacterized protein n=1 Tax=Phycicoccus sonneratiae TaxID=2807628 RepID=A0ABS2CM04_9MICO|nr:hypothetical protein [Phycicoccus sonneraticus]MBM6400906.1 hypothetical protein [Phycicoccus sonneraticus]